MFPRIVPLALCLAAAALPTRAAPPEPAVVSRSMSGAEVGTVLGREVFDREDKDVGQCVDILMGNDGLPVAGLIDVGGFLGVGTRRIAVAWRLLHFVHDSGGTRVVMDLPLDTAAGAPEFLGPDNTLIVVDRPSP